MQNAIIKIDKIKTKIPYDKCFIPLNTESKKSTIGLDYVMTKSGMVLEFSGKLFATPDSYGYLTKDNLNSLPEKILHLSDILVDSDYLFNQAPIYRVDICEDVIADIISCMDYTRIEEFIDRLGQNEFCMVKRPFRTTGFTDSTMFNYECDGVVATTIKDTNSVGEWYNDYPEPRWQIPGTIDKVTHWWYLPKPPKGE